MKRLCTLCARGGSRGVPNKNIRLIAGKPLIAHSLEQAKSTGLFDQIVVSSDSEEILKIAGQWGATHLVRRPDELASDNSPKLPVIRHCVEETEKALRTRYDLVVDLDATSPLRSTGDIIECVRLAEQAGSTNVLTAAPARRSPYFNLIEQGEDGGWRPVKPLLGGVTRRQDSPKCFDMNASIYAWRRDFLMDSDSVFHKNTLLHVMPEERSLDIDSELDFQIVEFLMTRKGAVSAQSKP